MGFQPAKFHLKRAHQSNTLKVENTFHRGPFFKRWRRTKLASLNLLDAPYSSGDLVTFFQEPVLNAALSETSVIVCSRIHSMIWVYSWRGRLWLSFPLPSLGCVRMCQHQQSVYKCAAPYRCIRKRSLVCSSKAKADSVFIQQGHAICLVLSVSDSELCTDMLTICSHQDRRPLWNLWKLKKKNQVAVDPR